MIHPKVVFDFGCSWQNIQNYVARREDISFADNNASYNLGEKIALVHSELSEGLEASRKSLFDTHLPDRPGLEVELADAVIRIMGIADHLNLDVAGAIIAKAHYNDTREDHKPENRAKEGGKKF